MASVLLGNLIKENYSLYRSFHFRRYTALCCSDVFGVATPASFPALFMEYMGLALLQYLVTELHFKVAVSLSGDRSDVFSNYTIHRLEYRNQRGHDQDWVFHYDQGGVLTPGSAGSVFQADLFYSILGKVEVEARLSPEAVQFATTPESLRYDNRDGLSEALSMDIQRRATAIGRPDQTLYMEAWRGVLYQVDHMGADAFVDERTILIQEVLMACVHRANLRAWPQIYREGTRETLKVWPLEALQATGGRQSTHYFADLNLKYFAALRRRVTNADVMDLGVFENMSRDLDVLATHWQARQFANHFFSLSKRYPDGVRILEDQ